MLTLPNNADIVRDEMREHVEHLRQFRTPKSGKDPSSPSVGKSLSGIVGVTVESSSAMRPCGMRLKSWQVHHGAEGRRCARQREGREARNIEDDCRS